MSEQKIPALPDADDFGCGDLYWNQDSVERIQREAYKAGRQHERERLEPLRVAVEAVNVSASEVFRALDTDKKRLAEITYRGALALLAREARTLLEADR